MPLVNCTHCDVITDLSDIHKVRDLTFPRCRRVPVALPRSCFREAQKLQILTTRLPACLQTLVLAKQQCKIYMARNRPVMFKGAAKEWPAARYVVVMQFIVIMITRSARVTEEIVL